ncbi:MAG: peptidoglycan DD-metalloendopeptidase family protein [Acidobacteriota bacterium]|jgi:septal ring factor EnvC (AmiA/AmiB activator)|nr:peptidoglycan DD-metalloendopeptidase family protein [Acidobacteriota bacterium]
MNTRRACHSALLIGWAAAAMLTVSVAAADLHRELDALRQQIGRVNKQLGSLDAARQPILAELARIDLKVEREQLEIQRIDLRQRQLTNEIGANQARRGLLEKELAQERSRAGKVARYLYKLGGQSYLKLFLRVDSLDQLFHNYHLFMILIRHHLDQINSVRSKTLALTQIDRQLESQRQQLNVRKQAHAEAIKRLDVLRGEQKNAVSRINRDRKTYMRLLHELSDRAGELEELIYRAGKGDTTTPMTHLKALKGRLPWPLAGTITSRFGKQRSTRFNTFVMNDGVEIKPAGGRDIRAVYPGKVIFSDYFKGYGNLIILQHAKNFHSLYGHCARFLKNRGERVRSGEVIGQVGDSGSTTGLSLYFAIRADLKPSDPLQWLSSP